jgi:hypothetical protein
MKTDWPAPARLLPRPRIAAALDQLAGVPIVWLCAPGGSGKTSLLAGSLGGFGGARLWYQVDEADADPAALFLALAQSGGSAEVALPRYELSSASRLSHFSRRFAAALVARHGGRLLLVVDDFQDAPPGARLAEVLGEMAGAAPGLRVLVASRVPPPAELARLQVHGGLALLPWDTLRLSADESRAFLQSWAVGRAVDESRVAVLHRLTEGWAAGLLLLSRSPGLPAEGLAPDAAERGLLHDYLARECLADATAAQRRALVATALLPEFDCELFARLLEIGDEAPLLLAQLAQRSFFLRCSDGQARTWRHHPLMRDFLLTQAEAVFGVAGFSRLRRRAAALLLARAEVDGGLRLLRDEGDVAAMAATLVAQVPRWLAQGRGASVVAWIRRLPPEVQAADPWLQHGLGMALLPSSPTEALGPLQAAFDGFIAWADRRGQLLACAGILESLCYGYAALGRLGPWVDTAAALLPVVAEPLAADEQARVMGSLFSALVLGQRAHPQLAAWRERALALAERTGDASLRANAAVTALMSHLWGGDYAAATVVAERLRPLCLAVDAVSPLNRLSGWLALAILAGNTPGMAPDFETVEQGLRVADESGLHVWDAELHGQGVVIALCAADLGRARLHLDRMAALLPPGHSVHSAGHHAFSAWWHLMRHEAPLALRHAEAAALAALAAGSVPLQRHAAVMRALAALELDQSALAWDAIEQLRAAEVQSANPRLRFVRPLLEAEWLRRAGGADGLVPLLAAAWQIGRENGYVSFYGWLPGLMARLVALSLDAGIEVDYLQRLVRLRRLMPDTSPLAVDAWPWPLRLSTLGQVELAGLPGPPRRGVKTPQKPLELLLALVAMGGQQVAESALADALWPDAEGDAARQSLAINLHRLRKWSGQDDLVTLEGGRLSLARALLWVDVAALQPLLEAAESSGAGHGGPWPVQDLDRALALYRGPFMADRSEPWAAALRARLHRRVGLQVVRALHRLLDEGRIEQASARIERAAQAALGSDVLRPVRARLCAADGSAAVSA